MPTYHYRCVDRNCEDQRIAGLDDHTALCSACGGLMLRLDENLFKPYFDEPQQEEDDEVLYFTT